MVFMFKDFEFLKKFGLLGFLFLSELFDIGSVSEFMLSFLIEIFEIPLLVLFLDGFVGIELNGFGDFRHGEVGVFIGLEGDGLIPAEEVELVKGKLITHIIVY